MNPSDNFNSRRDAMNPMHVRNRDILFNPLSVSVMGYSGGYPSFPEILSRSTLENAQLPQLWRKGSDSRGLLSDFSNGSDWSWYDYLFNPFTEKSGREFFGKAVGDLLWGSTTESDVQQIKQQAIANNQLSSSDPNYVSSETLDKILGFDLSRKTWWDNNKWYVMVGGLGSMAIVLSIVWSRKKL